MLPRCLNALDVSHVGAEQNECCVNISYTNIFFISEAFFMVYGTLNNIVEYVISWIYLILMCNYCQLL